MFETVVVADFMVQTPLRVSLLGKLVVFKRYDELLSSLLSLNFASFSKLHSLVSKLFIKCFDHIYNEY